MSRELLQKVIDNRIDGNLSTFFSTASNYYSELEEDLSEFDEIDRFTDFQAIGESGGQDGGEKPECRDKINRFHTITP